MQTMPTDENISDEPIFDASKKKKSKKRSTAVALVDTTVRTAAEANVIQKEKNDAPPDDADYAYEYLLGRIPLKDVAPSPAKDRVPLPQLARIGTRRTSFLNFALACKALRREEKQLQDYFTIELATTTSIDSNHALIARGRFSPSQIETVLRSFIRGYVLCKNCHSMDTWLGKSERLTVLRCANCKSQYCVSSIRPSGKSGTGNRSRDTV